MAGFTLGALMLVFKALTDYGAMARLLAPHVEFLLVGWTVQLTMGVAFWILPRFEGGVSRGPLAGAWLAFALLNAGVMLTAAAPLVAGLAGAGRLGRAAEAAAALAFSLHAWRRVKRPSV